MASWFGHTQTVASISKSVTTVAGGIICLETNLSNFMKKVIYYEGFFRRTSEKLPQEVNYAAKKLLRRCHEYRGAIREELQSSVAYVADAGRWIIGMEDWNTKMEKRMHQISELVLLANSLLAEYSITGNLGAQGAVEDLTAYLNVITSTIVLQDDALFQDSLKGNIVPSSNSSPRQYPVENTTPPSTSPIEDKTIVVRSLDLELDSPEDEDRFNPFNVTANMPTPVMKQSLPMAIPKKEVPVAEDNSSRSSSNSFTSDYCHLEKEYGDELNEMTSFSSTTATRKEKQHMSLKHTSSGRKKPYENAVYDLTVSFDFQKERASNPFVSKTFALDRKNSLGEHSIAEEDSDTSSPRQLIGTPQENEGSQHCDEMLQHITTLLDQDTRHLNER